MKTEEKSQILLRVDPDVKAWLEAEKESSGRSVTWLINHAVNLWRERLEKGRKGSE